METILDSINLIQNLFWEYIGFVIICLSGIYLTITSRGFQFKTLRNFKYNFRELVKEGRGKGKDGIHPFKLYFASVGGMIGLGNIILIGGAVVIGGPGSIFWMWIASFCGMLLKYSEIYLGVKYRVSNGRGSYNGGPMYYLQAAFKTKFFAYFAAFLLCIYGVEIYQFVVLVDRIEHTFLFDRQLVIIGLLMACLYTVVGGVRRLANLCSVMMPFFMLSYILICFYIIFSNYELLPSVFYEIFHGAFYGHAPLGGFVGSTMIMAAYEGTSRAVYAGDIGIGYDSVVQSETRITDPKKQAQIAIYALFSDTFICMMSTLLIAVTGAWHTMNDIPSANVVPNILSNYLPNADLFMTTLLFFAGFTTVVAFFTTGIKNASFLSPKYGKYLYITYAICAFIFFSEYKADKIYPIMFFVGGLLVLLNTWGILKLRNKIEF
jgi:alanine or glycine:cation symporter, AGCS family